MSEQDEQESNIVEFPELKFPPIEYGVTEAALTELAERYKDPDASTDDGYEHCKDGCRELTALRTGIETRRKDLKAPALNWGRDVDKQAKDIKRRIKLIEEPVRVEKERVDEIKQAEARKTAEAEQARIDGIKANIDKIAATAREQHPDDTAADYQQHMKWLTELAITDEVFGEFVPDAKIQRDAALFKLGQWHERAEQHEADDRQRKADQARLDQEREDLEAAQEKQREAEAKLEQDNREAEQRKREAKKAADKIEQEKHEADERKAADEKAARENTEREKAEAETKRVSDIKAAIRGIGDIAVGAERVGLVAESLQRLAEAKRREEPTEAEFQEFLPAAKTAWQELIVTLEIMAKDARDREEQARRDDEARLPDRDKLLRWCDAIDAIPEPEVLNDKAQKLLKRYGVDLSKLIERLRSDIEKL